MAPVRSLAIVLVLVAPHRAGAQPQLTPVTSRDYAIDLYEGFALGTSELVAMGGAGAANAKGSSGTLINPSAPAVRQTTDIDSWSWDYHLDYLDGSLSTDYDNAAIPMPQGTSARVVTGGLALRIGDWAAAVTTTAQTESVSTGSGSIVADAVHGKLAVARWVDRLDLALGFDVQIGQFDLKDGNTQLFQIQGGGFEAGAQWLPRLQSFRLGASVSTPVTGTNVTVSSCMDLASCDGYILPTEVYVPWRVVAGAAYRWAPTAWNQLVKTPWRDEQAVTLVADVVGTGSSPNAYGLQAFGQHELERSGRHTSWSLRGGAEYEWLPGRLRVRGGTYWEPGRFVGVDGRLHVTFGTEVRVFEFELWGPRRGSITLTGDLSSQYRNVALSIGFWH